MGFWEILWLFVRIQGYGGRGSHRAIPGGGGHGGPGLGDFRASPPRNFTFASGFDRLNSMQRIPRRRRRRA